MVRARLSFEELRMYVRKYASKGHKYGCTYGILQLKGGILQLQLYVHLFWHEARLAMLYSYVVPPQCIIQMLYCVAATSIIATQHYNAY